MYLKEIELKGFKSFAKDTVIELVQGINAIVGPNGSGKSNIIDALRWALGDQSQRNLRVENSGDLIFTGNELCKSSSNAKVRLLFDDIKNTKTGLSCPLDCNTLEIEKTIDSLGKTEYYLNKEPVRLKDITEILASLQLGVKGFSIINQGSIENILKVSQEERAIMLEEILGLRQLEIKKEASLRKLSLTLINLDKVTSLENEILPHYRSLKKNVMRFEKQKELKQMLKDYEKDYYSFKYKEITKNSVDLKAKLQEAQNKLNIIENNIKKEEEKVGLATTDEAEDKTNQFTYLRQTINEQIRIKNEEKNKLIYELAKTESILDNIPKYTFKPPETKEFIIQDMPKIYSTIYKIRSLIQEIVHIDDIRVVRDKIKIIEQEISKILIDKTSNSVDNTQEQVNLDIKELQNKIQEFKTKINTIERDLNMLYNQLEDIKQQEQEHNKNIKIAFAVLEQQQHEKMIILNELKTLELSEEKIKINLENLKNQIGESVMAWEEFLSYADTFDKQFAEQEINNLENKILRQRKILQELGFVDDSIIEEYKSVDERLTFLQKEKTDLKQAVDDLQHIIKELTIKIHKQFNDAIKEINKEFNKYLQILFGGGKGSVEIVQSSNNLNTLEESETIEHIQEIKNLDVYEQKDIDIVGKNKTLGVDIKVKLPKSKLEGIESLSGGERALVSLALLFAIVAQSKPPLLVLDEVDAALDEENARRFGEMLQGLSKQTQFIVITHNWLTMAVANIIYGITIGKEKYSQVLSLQLDESRDFAKN